MQRHTFVPGDEHRRMDPALAMSNRPNVKWQLARQMDVTHAVTGLPSPDADQKPWGFQPLLELKNRFDGPARPDHHPDIAGEGAGRGPLYSIGYVRGLIEQAQSVYEQMSPSPTGS